MLPILLVDVLLVNVRKYTSAMDPSWVVAITTPQVKRAVDDYFGGHVPRYHLDNPEGEKLRKFLLEKLVTHGFDSPTWRIMPGLVSG